MNTYTEIRDFLRENNIADDDMQVMWDSLYESNWKVRNLADNGKSWEDLNTSALKSLIEQYNKAKTKTEKI